MNKESLSEAYRPARQFVGTRQINYTMQINRSAVWFCGWFTSGLLANVPKQKADWAFSLFTYRTSLRSLSLKPPNGPKKHRGIIRTRFLLLWHRVPWSARAAGKTSWEGGWGRGEQETARGREKGGVGPIGAFAMRLICTTALNWLQQLINVLKSWHKKFI